MELGRTGQAQDVQDELLNIVRNRMMEILPPPNLYLHLYYVLADAGRSLADANRPDEATLVLSRALYLTVNMRGEASLRQLTSADLVTALQRSGRCDEAKRVALTTSEYLKSTLVEMPLHDSKRDEFVYALLRQAEVLDRIGYGDQAADMRHVVQEERHKSDRPKSERRNSEEFAPRTAITAAALEPVNGLGCDVEWSHLENRVVWTIVNPSNPQHRDVELACKLAKRACDRASTDSNAWCTLGAAMYRAEDYKRAVVALEKAIELRKSKRNGPLLLRVFADMFSRLDKWQSNELGFDYYFLAMAQCRLGNQGLARQYLDMGEAWQNQHAPQNQELLQFRDEARQVVAEKSGLGNP